VLTKKTKLDVDKKMHNYVLTKKNAQLRVEEKKKKKKKGLPRTPHCRQPATKANARRLDVAGMRQCSRSLKPKKNRSSIKQKEVMKNIS
jgi:hypothetical protein